MNIKTTCLAVLAGIILLTTGCEKYLEKKPNQNQVVPATLKDAQAILDNNQSMNQYDLGSSEVSADTYLITEARYLAISESFRRMYTWEADNTFAPTINEWRNCYERIYLANAALETVDKVEMTGFNQEVWSNVKGQALYFRAHFMLQAAFIWTLAYDEASANTDLGLPLRLNTNFNSPSVRSSVKATYEQIISDLTQAIVLLPETQIALTRPSKQAALGLLSRVYFAMRKYPEARILADQCLSIKHNLLDYNTLIPTAAFPIAQLNPEVLFQSRMNAPIPIANSSSSIVKSLYDAYEENDLRKVVFFRINADKTYGFKGSYEGSGNYFSGVATDEIYLIRAEVFARENKLAEAASDLNDLLRSRWKKDKLNGKTLYIDRSFTNQQEAIETILMERRKELIFRGVRWMDIKRLNKENQQIVLTRNISGKSYVLSPNDLKYALPIPEDVIAISGMQQNLR